MWKAKTLKIKLFGLIGPKSRLFQQKEDQFKSIFSKRSAIRPRSDKADLLGSTALSSFWSHSWPKWSLCRPHCWRCSWTWACWSGGCTSRQSPARPLRVHGYHVFRISFSSLVAFTKSYPIILFTFSLGFIMSTLSVSFSFAIYWRRNAAQVARRSGHQKLVPSFDSSEPEREFSFSICNL